MNGLTLFLESNDASQFSAINGYFYGGRVYTEAGAFKASSSDIASSTTSFIEGARSAFLGSVDELETYWESIDEAPAQVGEYYYSNVQPGTNELYLCGDDVADVTNYTEVYNPHA